MRLQRISEQKGVTLIELLVGLVICGITMGAIYQLFVVQTAAYNVHDQVAEVQQSVRSAMEILLRDLRMAGYDDDSIDSTVTISVPIATPVQASDITVSYEYYDSVLTQYQKHTIRYWRDAGTSTLFRQRTINGVAEAAEALLENADALNFTYGMDPTEDGVVDSWGAWDGFSKIIAVRVSLTGRPDSENLDVQKRVSPRTLTSTVTFRNIMMR